MDNEHSKRISRGSADPFTQLDQVDSDFALALALQEQERATLWFASSESESDGNESFSSDVNDGGNFQEFFESQTEAEVEFLETEENNSIDQEMEEDDIDPDELSYEELVDLGEIIGEESKGLPAEEISSCLRLFECQSVNSQTPINRCVICQVDYEEGEMLVALPCDHSYHLDCISKWLQIKKICPICSTEVSAPKIAATV